MRWAVPDRRGFTGETIAQGGVDGAETQDLEGAAAAVEFEETPGPVLAILLPVGVVRL
ncbi:hypothetical protein [Azospirillum argentinense]|uniref:Uncharacterized protein n=1 Tax=Azospirillum argentinense TaxID=2970906 RepID=A0A5B0KM93_9PROT|nr:hypothetical protein [Azospirillum argentinense]KAA1053797.1 hypothetical protein FH063_002379 [Azospirillum argentinense]